MNKLVLITLFIISIIGSFIFGAEVGAVKKFVYTESLQAHRAMSDLQYQIVVLETVEDYKAEKERSNYSDMYEAIITYGRYLNSWWSYIPVLGKTDELTLSTYRGAIEFYLENKYVEPERSAEDIAKSIITDMLADGSLKEENSDYIYKMLKNDIAEKRSNFNTAVKAISK